MRIHYEGAIYHVTFRGVDRRVIFEDDRDRHAFLDRLERGVEEQEVRIYLFCLMPNHLHLVLQTHRANLSEFMHQLETAYVMYFNWRHQRSGHLMQSRFWSKPVENSPYLLRLSRYVHLNPVRGEGEPSGSVRQQTKRLRSYPWSSYAGYVGLRPQWGFIEEEPVLSLTGEQDKSKQRLAYRQFVEAGLLTSDEEFEYMMRNAPWGIGSEAFQDSIRSQYIKIIGGEEARGKRKEARCSAEEIAQAVAETFGEQSDALRKRRYGCKAQAVLLYLLTRYSGMNQQEAGRWAGIRSGAAVSIRIRRLQEEAGKNEELAERIRGVEQRLMKGNVEC